MFPPNEGTFAFSPEVYDFHTRGFSFSPRLQEEKFPPFPSVISFIDNAF